MLPPRPCAFVLLLALLCPAVSAARGAGRRAIPPGHERAVMTWLEPLAQRGFAGFPVDAISIVGEEVRVHLGRDAATNSDSHARCSAPDWARAPASLRVSPADAGLAAASVHSGRVTVDGLCLDWFVCPDGGLEHREEALVLGRTLAASLPDGIWSSSTFSGRADGCAGGLSGVKAA